MSKIEHVSKKETFFLMIVPIFFSMRQLGTGSVYVFVSVSLRPLTLHILRDTVNHVSSLLMYNAHTHTRALLSGPVLWLCPPLRLKLPG